MAAEQQARKQFLAGEIDSLRLGGYGGTAHLEAVSGEIRISVTQPKRRQRTLGPDSTRTREQALELADVVLARVKGARVPTVKPRPASVTSDGIPLVTPRDIYEAYLRGRLGCLPDGILGWGRTELEALYRKLSPAARKSIPSFDSIYGLIVAARRFDRDGIMPFDAPIDSREPGDLTDYLLAQVVAGSSPTTMASYFGRIRTAVRFFKRKWPKRWRGRIDPTEGVDRPSTRGVKPEEIGEDRAQVLIDQLRTDGQWRAFAALKMVRASGRRVGAVGPTRQGAHLDAVPLRATDFHRREDGALIVTWRAEAAKGEAFGRGDEEQVCPAELEHVYGWLTRCHPNPKGPDYPLIWDPDDPTKGIPYHKVSRAFRLAWERAFGEAKPKGLLWHSVCRTTITTIADAADVVAAAEHTGRTPETVMRHYKRRRIDAQARTARLLDELRD